MKQKINKNVNIETIDTLAVYEISDITSKIYLTLSFSKRNRNMTENVALFYQ